MIEFVKDRPGHDVRYSLDSGKLLRQAGWQSKVDFAQGIRKTISWCLANQDWLLSKHGGILPIGRTNR
jgi:dTDP-glucose 4,6-dehydratase